MLRENHSLVSVRLSGNRFTAAGYTVFTDLLRSGASQLKQAGEVNLFSLTQLARGHVQELEVVSKEVGDFDIALLVRYPPGNWFCGEVFWVFWHSET